MANEKTDHDLLAEISEKLDQLIGLIAARGKTKNEQIPLLIGLGLSNPTISALTGIKTNAIGQWRFQLKKKSKSPRKAKKQRGK